MAGTPQFIDTSSFNGPIDWQVYKPWAAQWDGISRVAMKSTEGVGFTDPRFAANRAGALAAGIDCIYYYHFARPDLGNTATAEANWQHSVVGGIRANDLIMLDYEVENVQATASWALAWLQMASALYGKPAGIYASSYYISQHLQDSRLAQYKLWLANWQYSPTERPPVPAPWTQYEFVQYTDRASGIPGISGSVDADIFLGKEATPVNNTTYGPGKGDFDSWFSVGPDDNWTCKQTHSVLQGANKALYSQLSIDGNTLPVIGLPVENEQYHTDQGGYSWSSQRCERATIVYDPSHKHDSQPGFGASYLAHTQTTTVTKLPDAVVKDIQQIYKDAGL